MATTKTLITIQKLCKAGRILSKIVFIFCLIGGIACLAGMISLALIPHDINIGRVTIRGLIERSSEISLGTCYASMAAAVVSCAGEAVISKMAELYFKHELKAGTPFTTAGAKELIRLGICTIAISIGTAILAAVAYQIVSVIFENVREVSFSDSLSVGLGIMFIFSGFLCRYGAEATAEKQKYEEQN